MANNSVSGSRPGLSLTPLFQISKDAQGSDNPIPLSPQLPKPGESKPGVGTGESSPLPAYGNHSDNTVEMHDQKKKDVFRPSLLDMETGCRDRWRQSHSPDIEEPSPNIPELQQNNIPSSLLRVKRLSENAVMPSRGSMNPWALHLQKLGLELKCPLCLEFLKRPFLLPCDHIFCNSCLPKTTEFGSECPLCEAQYGDSDLRCLPMIENMVTIYRSLDSAFSAKAFQMDLNQADQLSPRSPPSFGDNKDSENDSNDQGSDDSPQNYKAENLLQLNSDNKRKRRQESHINSDNKIPKLQQNNIPSSLFRVKMLSENAVLPSRGSTLSAGCDLSSVSAAKVPARGKALIPTDLSIAIPEGTYARIAPRSGLTWKHSIDVGGGVIDADYRGPVRVILFNHSDVDFEVKVGDRIAQSIIEKIVPPNAVEVEDLDATVRGAGGFGNSFRVKRLSENAVFPSRGSPFSAGCDLSSVSAAKVPARGKALIPTDLSIAIPEGTYARIAPRSGLAWKHSIDVGAGVIHADYRGPIKVILFNHSDVDFEVKVGERIAQLIIQKIETDNAGKVEDLDATVRGAGGFGSTGVRACCAS